MNNMDDNIFLMIFITTVVSLGLIWVYFYALKGAVAVVKCRSRKIKIRDDYEVFNQGGGWGMNFKIMKQYEEHYRIAGHWPTSPENGDILLINMQSGRVGVFILQNMDHCLNPTDMFFCDAYFFGFQDDEHMVDFNYKGKKSLSNTMNRFTNPVDSRRQYENI